MNKMTFGFPGGHPIYHDHLQFQNEAFRNAIIGIGKGFELSDPVRLYGIQRSGTTITAGALLKDGEIYMFDEKTNVDVPIAGYQDVVNISIESPPEGWVKFNDNDIKQVLEIRRAVHSQKATGDIGPSDIPISSLKSFNEVFFKPVMSADFALNTGWQAVQASTFGNPRALRTRDGLVRLLGAVNKPDPLNPVSMVAFVLPVGFRPSQDIMLYLPHFADAEVKHTIFQINATTGEVTIGNPPTYFPLDQVSFNQF